MPDERDEHSEPLAKRTGREDPDARELPEEFVDEMRTNRFRDVPEPGEEDD